MNGTRQPGHRIRPAAVTAALLAACIAVAPALAGWESDYKKGKKAYDDGNPVEAIPLLKAAAEKKKEEKANAIKASGMFFEPYLPHFYLGLCYLETKQYKKSVRMFNLSESQGVVQRYDDLYRILQNTRPKAQAALDARSGNEEEGQVAAKGPEAPESGSETSGGPGTAGTAREQPPPPSEAGEGQPEPKRGTAQEMFSKIKEKVTPSGRALARARQDAESEIGAAEAFTKRERENLQESEIAQLDDAADAVRSAESADEVNDRRSRLRTLQSRLETKAGQRKAAREKEAARIAQERDARAAAAKAVASARREAEPVVREARTFLSANRSSLQPTEIRQLEQRIAAVEKAGSVDAARAGARSLRQEIDDAAGLLQIRAKQAGLSARDSYEAGARAYFQGRYAEAVPALAKAAGGTPNDPQPHVYLGSALYRQHLLSRAEDDSLRKMAEDSFKAALAIKDDYQMDEKLFPPKVIAFFNEVAGRSGP